METCLPVYEHETETNLYEMCQTSYLLMSENASESRQWPQVRGQNIDIKVCLFACIKLSMSVLCEYAITAHFAYCRIFARFSKVRTSHIFLHKLAFSTVILTLSVLPLPISIRFRYLGHLVANRTAPSTCLDPCGKRWGSWFQVILYHISAHFCHIFGVNAVRIFF